MNTIKCVIWDLDNTLWKGTLLESRQVTLRPGIIEIIKELDGRGILHSIASRNDYDDAMRLLHENGISQYFLYPQINWNAKSFSIQIIQKKLNIAMDSILFVDDQAFEREEVTSVNNNIQTLNADRYTQLLDDPRLMPRFITEDSRRRRLMYQEDMYRQQEEAEYQEVKVEFLAGLQMKFIISEANKHDLRRAEELTIRTNQLNTTGQTYDYDELKVYIDSNEHKVFICELTDKYGSYGKIGLALIEVTDETWHIKLLLMSCRVISRGVGSVLLTHLMQHAKKEGKKLYADLKNTGKNKMMYVTYQFAGFTKVNHNESTAITLYQNDLSGVLKLPDYIEVIVNH